MKDDRESPSDEQDMEDPFDRRWAEILDAEADQLRKYAEQLLMTGAISIERPTGVVTARFRRPVWRYSGSLTWHRRPELDIDRAAADGSGGGRHGQMVAKYRDRENVIDEMMFALAIELACLDEDEEDE